VNNIIYEYKLVSNSTLEQHIENTSSLQQYFKADFNNLKARQYCGIIHHNGNNS